MEHLIKEIFLVVPNLGLRVAEGQYDLCGPKDEILSPSNWGPMIEPGWEITMRMWPNPERPPWEYAGPRAMLQDRHTTRSQRQDEASHRSVSQQEADDSYDLENPRLGELGTYRSEELTTQHVGDIEIEEQGPQAHSELHRKRLNLVSGHSHDSNEWEGDHATNFIHTHSGNPQLREQRAYHRRKPTNELVGDIIVEERHPRTYARPPRKYLNNGDYGSDSDEWDRESNTPKGQRVLYEHSETPQSRELGPHQTGERITRRDSEESLLAKSRSPASVRTRTIVDVKPPERDRKHRPAPGPFTYSSEEDEDTSSSPLKAFSEHDRRTRSLSSIRRYEAEKERIRQREFRERERRERNRREAREARDRAAFHERLEQERARVEERERVVSLERQERQREREESREERRERAALLKRLERQRERDEERER